MEEEKDIQRDTRVSGDIAAGDFVGRDKTIFLGRDVPVYKFNIENLVEGNVGGVVGKVGDREDVDPLATYSDTKIRRIGAQIDRLRGRITRLVPAEDALLKLAKLREPKPMVRWDIEALELSVGGVTTRLRPLRKKLESDTETSLTKEYLDRLSEIEAQIVPGIDAETYSKLLQHLSNIADAVNIRIANLNSLFVSIVYSTTSTHEIVENIISRIGHSEFQDEAAMHLGAIVQLVQKLNIENLTRPNFDVLSDEAYGAIGIMAELEKRRLIVERLLQADRHRRNWTIASVIAYIIEK